MEINWTIHPVFYQLTHPWHWLVYGQNSNGVAALTATVASGAAICAALFAVRTYRATVLQLDLAKAQVEIEKTKHLEIYSPHIVVTSLWPLDISERLRVRITNVGKGKAIDVTGVDSVDFFSKVLVEGASHLGIVNVGSKITDTLHQYEIIYRTSDGRGFKTMFFLNPGVCDGTQNVYQIST